MQQVRDLIILGTTVHAREMADIVERINRAAPTWNLLGYCGTTPGDPRPAPPPGCAYLGGLETVARYPDALLATDNDRLGVDRFPRERFACIVDPTVFVARTARMGAGCVIYPGCYLGAEAALGDFVFCLSGSVINHDDRIGSRAVFASGVCLAGGVRVGDDVYLGQTCTVRQNLSIGARSLVGMGAVVVRDVEPGVVVAGNPARVLRRNTDQGAVRPRGSTEP